jgi:hypothetical protein
MTFCAVEYALLNWVRENDAILSALAAQHPELQKGAESVLLMQRNLLFDIELLNQKSVHLYRETSEQIRTEVADWPFMTISPLWRNKAAQLF